MEFLGSWDRYIPLMEFAYNNSFQSSIGIAPYEALYGRKCRTPLCWTDLNEYYIYRSRHSRRYRIESTSYSAEVKGG